MPCSPKDVKPIITASETITNSESEQNQTEVKPSPPAVFTFNTVPTVSSEYSFNRWIIY